jgi:hypothetical protein
MDGTLVGDQPFRPKLLRRCIRVAMQEIQSLLERSRIHQHRLVSAETAQARVHGSSRMARINKWLAVKITTAVGTMWCAYAFAALALVSLPAAIQSHNPVIIVQWISTIFLQLVLLSIIIVGQQVLSEAADQRAEADHETLKLLHEINVTQLSILNELRGEPPAEE